MKLGVQCSHEFGAGKATTELGQVPSPKPKRMMFYSVCGAACSGLGSCDGSGCDACRCRVKG